MNAKCLLCGGELVKVVLAPLDPAMPFAVVEDGSVNKKNVSIKTYICKRCGNISGRTEKEDLK